MGVVDKGKAGLTKPVWYTSIFFSLFFRRQKWKVEFQMVLILCRLGGFKIQINHNQAAPSNQGSGRFQNHIYYQ